MHLEEQNLSDDDPVEVMLDLILLAAGANLDSGDVPLDSAISLGKWIHSWMLEFQGTVPVPYEDLADFVEALQTVGMARFLDAVSSGTRH